MLIQFRFRNYRSFRDETVLHMTSGRMTENTGIVRVVDGDRLLPVTAIYGANSSGKSNFIRAFAFMTDWVINSSGFRENSLRFHEPYLLDTVSPCSPSEFEVFFTSEENGMNLTYNYGFVLDNECIREEWLNVKKSRYGKYKSLFYREENHIDDDSLLGDAYSLLEGNISGNVLVLSLAEVLAIDILKPVFQWFCDNRIIISSDGIDTDCTYENDPGLLEFLTIADPSIRDIDSNEGKVLIFHQVNGRDALLPISISDESSGLKKLYSLYGPLRDVSARGSVLMVDDLDATLHPLLTRFLAIGFFERKSNDRNAQLIYTTHDSWQMVNDSLRRDQIWFVEKDDDSVSRLFSLAEFRTGNDSKIRKDENYQKNYMLGKYGAIPRLERLKS